MNYLQAVVIDIKRILTITQIYHLEILKNILLNLIQFLPQLHTLTIDTVSITQTEPTTALEEVIISSIRQNNKIKYIYIKKINYIEQFESILELATGVECIKIDLIDINILKSIFNMMKIKKKRIVLYVRSTDKLKENEHYLNLEIQLSNYYIINFNSE